VCVNDLHKVVNLQTNEWESNPWPLNSMSDSLTTIPLSHTAQQMTDREYEDGGFAEHGTSDQTDDEACNTDDCWVEIIPPPNFTGQSSGRQSLIAGYQPSCMYCD